MFFSPLFGAFWRFYWNSYGRTYGQTDGRMDGQMDRQTEIWTDGQTLLKRCWDASETLPHVACFLAFPQKRWDRFSGQWPPPPPPPLLLKWSTTKHSFLNGFCHRKECLFVMERAKMQFNWVFFLELSTIQISRFLDFETDMFGPMVKENRIQYGKTKFYFSTKT